MKLNDHDSNEIKDIPDIPKGIFEAAQSGKLVLFIGAGVSRIVGCPSWKDFAIEYLKDLHNKQVINFFEFEKLKTLDARKLLTICKNIYKEKKLEPPEMKAFLEGEKDLFEEIPIYDNLYSFNAIYVTTNYDDHLDKVARQPTQPLLSIEIESSMEEVNWEKEKSEEKVFYLKDELLISKLKNGNVIHIHGSVENETTTIMTIVDYIEHYKPNSKPAVFLKEIFEKYTVLFIGYGLEEYEILEFMLSKTNPATNEIRHYMLYPIFKSESNLLEYYEKYYENLGVQLIPYPIDKGGYKHLTNVIREWAKQIGPIVQPQGFWEKVKLIDEVVK